MTNTRRRRGAGAGRTSASRTKTKSPRRAAFAPGIELTPPEGKAISPKTGTAKAKAKKTAVKKAVAQKGPVKKAATKKAPAKKTVARKPAAKKAAPKLTPEKTKMRRDLEKQIAKLSKEVDKAEKEAKKALKVTERRYVGVLKQLKADRARLQVRMSQLAKQGEGAFDDIKTGVEGAYKELSEAVVKAYGHFR